MASLDKIHIYKTRSSGSISPLLFGHNLEHARPCIWQGLSEELVRNPVGWQARRAPGGGSRR